MECENKTAHESFLSLLLRLQKEGSMPIPLTNETITALMFVSFLITLWPSSSRNCKENGIIKPLFCDFGD